MRSTVQTRLIIGFTLAAILIVVLGTVSYQTTRTLVRNAESVDHTHQVIEALDTIRSLLKDAETGQRGFVLTGAEDFLEPYNAATVAVFESVQHVTDLTSDNASQQRRIAEASPLIQAKLDELSTTIHLRRTEGFDSAIKIVLDRSGKHIMDELRLVLGDMTREEARLLRQRSVSTENAASFAKAVALFGTLMSLVFLSAVAAMIARSITRNLNQSIDSVTESSSRLNATVEEHEKITYQQNTAFSETLATTSELAQSARQAADQATSAASESESALNLAQEGNTTVRDTLSVMEELNRTSLNIREQMIRLSEQVGRIGQITDLVKEIAGQTDLLSLNAAVESARAGEHGRGFAVVATEIRKLADESRRSASDISKLVTEIRGATSATVTSTEEGADSIQAGIQQVQHTGKAFDSLFEAVSRANESVSQITLNLNQQSIGVSQVEVAMGSLEETSDRLETGIRTTREEITRLVQVTGDLRALA
jgi:methyl-accepting chemotaxis protein